MPTFGSPNMVGHRDLDYPYPTQQSTAQQVKPYLPSATLGAVGGRLTYNAIRPNAAGRIRRAESKVADLDDKIANEMKYNRRWRKPQKSKIVGYQRDRVRAEAAADIIRQRAPHGMGSPKRRLVRGAVGGGLLATAALAYPWQRKKVADAQVR